MAHETGVSTGAYDLVDKIRLFCISQGWSVNRWTSGRELCLEKDGNFINIRGFQNETMNVNRSSVAGKYGIVINGSDGFSSGAAWDRQPGYPNIGGTAATDQAHALLPMVTSFGPFPSYHLFSMNSGDTIYLELEITTGVYLRMGFGRLNLFNPASAGGGRFFYATGGSHVTNSTSTPSWLGSDIDSSSYALEEVPFRWPDLNTGGGRQGSFLRSAFGSFDNWCSSANLINQSLTAQACGGGGVHDKVLRDASPSPLNGIALLTPNVVSVNRDNEYLNPVGEVPGLRYMDMTNYLPGDEFSFGGDTWIVFPWHQKGGRSAQRGIAYLLEE